MMREIIDGLNEYIYLINAGLRVGARPSPTEIIQTLHDTIKLAKQKQMELDQLKSLVDRARPIIELYKTPAQSKWLRDANEILKESEVVNE